MSNIKILENSEQFETELTAAGEKLVVVYYMADWCAPCKTMKPVIETLSKKYENIIFITVDVDVCEETVMSQGVTAMPTFAFHKNMEKVDSMQGADPEGLEEKIIQYAQKITSELAGHVDLAQFILRSNCECLNEADSHPLSNVFEDNEDYLESDCDEQLMISVTFRQPIKLNSIKLKSPADKGPKQIKIFINQPNTLDFDSGESNTPIQEIELTSDQLSGSPIRLHYVKYQNVTNVQFFIKNNQTCAEKTVITYMAFIGTPLSSTNMGDFKRVCGTVGEIC